MTDFITAVTSQVTVNSLWSSVSNAAPLIITMVLFAFGYRVVRRVINGTSKGKGKV